MVSSNLLCVLFLLLCLGLASVPTAHSKGLWGSRRRRSDPTDSNTNTNTNTNARDRDMDRDRGGGGRTGAGAGTGTGAGAATTSASRSRAQAREAFIETQKNARLHERGINPDGPSASSTPSFAKLSPIELRLRLLELEQFVDSWFDEAEKLLLSPDFKLILDSVDEASVRDMMNKYLGKQGWS
jgi:hypothetical protein